MAGRVENKVCVVTGAAQGIGRAIATCLAREGAHVMITDIDGDRAAAVGRGLLEEGRSVASQRADVAVRTDIVEMLDATVERFGGVDVYFNNAGFNLPMRFLEITEDNWNSIMRVNALGVLVGTQEAAKKMIAAGKGGKIINTASIAGRQGYPDFAPYCASKAAVISLTQAAARGLVEHGITVNGFSPGVVDTPLWESLDRQLFAMGASSAEGEAMRIFSEGILMGRPATPDDISPTALFLASSDSDYITGQVVAIDGGMVLV